MLVNICNNTFSNTFDTSEWFLVMFAIICQFQHIYDLGQELISIFYLINIIGSLNQRRENNGLSIGYRIKRNTK